MSLTQTSGSTYGGWIPELQQARVRAASRAPTLSPESQLKLKTRDYTREAVSVAAGMPVAPVYFTSTQSYAPGVRVGGHAESYKATTTVGRVGAQPDKGHDNTVDMSQDFRLGTTHPFDTGSSMYATTSQSYGNRAREARLEGPLLQTAMRRLQEVPQDAPGLGPLQAPAPPLPGRIGQKKLTELEVTGTGTFHSTREGFASRESWGFSYGGAHQHGTTQASIAGCTDMMPAAPAEHDKARLAQMAPAEEGSAPPVTVDHKMPVGYPGYVASGL